jgi:8-oxo-dGTP diphosphatase
VDLDVDAKPVQCSTWNVTRDFRLVTTPVRRTQPRVASFQRSNYPALMPKKNIIEVIARGVLVHRGRVLVCRNRKRRNAFLPGGHVDFGEPAGKALEREIREELGVRLHAGRLLGALEATFRQRTSGRKSPGQFHHEVNLVYLLELPPGRTGRSATIDPADLKSREPHIEFIWVERRQLIGPRPKVRLLPEGITAFIPRS